jgi:hypothetical protein
VIHLIRACVLLACIALSLQWKCTAQSPQRSKLWRTTAPSGSANGTVVLRTLAHQPDPLVPWRTLGTGLDDRERFAGLRRITCSAGHELPGEHVAVITEGAWHRGGCQIRRADAQAAPRVPQGPARHGARAGEEGRRDGGAHGEAGGAAGERAGDGRDAEAGGGRASRPGHGQGALALATASALY